jgi:hypothetical protein
MQKIFYTEEELVNKGYGRSVSRDNEVLHNTDTLFQKVVKSPHPFNSVRYFINCWWYHQSPNVAEGELMWTIQFHRSDDQTVDVTMFGNYTVEEVEQEAEDMFDAMGYINYSDCR